MIWYICLAFSIILIVFAGRNLLFKSFGALRMVWAVLCLASAVFIIYIPIYFGKYNVIAAFFGDFVNVLRTVSLDAEYLENYEAVREGIGSGILFRIYMFVLGILHVLMPLVSAFAAYNVLLKCLTDAKMGAVNLRGCPLFVFSERNEQSELLAKDIVNNIKRCDILFLNSAEILKSEGERRRNYYYQEDGIRSVKISHRKGKDIYYLCISDDDGMNMEDALFLLEKYTGLSKEIQEKAHVYLFTGNKDADIIIDSAQKGSVNLRIMNPSESIVYRHLGLYPLYAYAKKKKIHVLLLGKSPVIFSFLRTISWVGQLDGYELIIDLIAPDAEKTMAEFRVDYPDLFSEHFNIRMFSAKSTFDILELIKENALEATYVVTDLGSDAENIDMSIRLRRLFYKGSPTFEKCPAVFVRVRSAENRNVTAGLRTSEGKEERRVSYRLVPFGDYEDLYTYRNLICSDLDGLSRNVHLMYEEIFSTGEVNVREALGRYNLFEVKKRSNVANALHIRYKLALLGLDYSEDESAEEVRLEDYLDNDRLELLAKAEHNRWMAFLQSEGWTTATLGEVEYYKKAGLSGGRHECQLLKMHPYICDFNELVYRSDMLGLEDSTVYDRELIARIPGILHDKWGVSGKRYKIIKKQED